jgi:hypothetical protein
MSNRVKVKNSCFFFWAIESAFLYLTYNHGVSRKSIKSTGWSLKNPRVGYS